MHAPMNVASSEQHQRRSRTRRTTVLLALAALGFYVGFIVVQMMRGRG
jgi:uncharacterized membrane protein